MLCPKCKTKLKIKQFDYARADICTKCKGAWLDEGELEDIVRYHREKVRGERLRFPIKPMVVEDVITGTKPCPLCSLNMIECKLSGSGDTILISYSLEGNEVMSPLIIDRCPSGHGLWFDHGEVKKVINGLDWERERLRRKTERIIDGIQAYKPSTRKTSPFGSDNTFLGVLGSIFEAIISDKRTDDMNDAIRESKRRMRRKK